MTTATSGSDTMLSVKPTALSGFHDASSYEKHRPTYPPSSVEYLLKAAKILGESDVRILEIAAGTGKFTSLLAAREENFEILAIEPHDEMRKVLTEKGMKNVKVIDGFAEDLSSVSDEWADAVIVAQVKIVLVLWYDMLIDQGFHW